MFKKLTLFLLIIGLATLVNAESKVVGSFSNAGTHAMNQTKIVQSLITINSTDFDRAEDTIKYDGPNADALGLTAGGTYWGAVQFTAVDACTLKSAIFFNYDPTTTPGWIYLQAAGATPGAKIDSVSYPITPSPAQTWVRVDFPTPHYFAAGTDFWLNVRVTHAVGYYPFGIDAGPSVTPARSYISMDGASWSSLVSIGFSNNWNLRAIGKIVRLPNDVGVDEILSPGAYHTPNMPMTPSASVKNYGSAAQSNFQVVCSIVGAGLSYTNPQTVTTSLAPGATTTVNFLPLTPTTPGVCTVKMRTNLVGDQNPANDRKTRTCNISFTSQIIIGTGTTSSPNQPVYRYWNYSAHEVIYLQSEINVAGNINNIAWNKASGTDVNPIDAVTIYMKQTTDNTLASGTYDLTGYTQVYSGTFPNDATSGWMDITLGTPFAYDNSSNLQILVIKGYQLYTSSYPYYYYTATTSTMSRYDYDDNVPPTLLTATTMRPNVRLTMSTQAPPANDVGVLAIRAPGIGALINVPYNPIAVVKNYGTQAQSFSVICSIVGSGIVRFTNTKPVNSLAPGDTQRAIFDPFTPTVVEIETVIMRTLLPNDTNPLNNRKSQACVIYSFYQDFEANDGGYVPDPATGAWEWGTPTPPPDPYSGTKLWATVLAGNYVDNANWKLTSCQYTATANNPTFGFMHWYSIEGTAPDYLFDGGNVKISIAGGPWTVINPVGGYTGVAYTTNVAIPGESCYSGSMMTWTPAVFTLPVTSGQQFQIRWHFGSDPSVSTYPGWYVDDVTGSGLMPSGIAEENPNKLPFITTLNAPKPNPVTNGLAHISFTIASPTKAALKIYDASGRLVKTLVNTDLGTGVYNYIWNGKDDNNHAVAEGVYFYTLQTDNHNSTKKLVFTR